MFNFLPKKKDQKWLKMWPVIMLILLVITVTLRLIFLSINTVEENEILGLLIFCLIPASAISLSGYLGAKLIPVLTAIGIVVGYGFMIHFLNKDYKLSGLVGGIVFYYAFLISLGIAIVSEIVYYFYKKRS
jgi:hypothetical protein